MKIALLLLLTVLSVTAIDAANWEWVVSSGSNGMDRVWDMALDPAGNILVTGEFTDTLLVGDISISGFGLTDIFVTKYSPAGVPLWARVFGGTEGDVGLSIDTDADGNSYLTGYYSGTAHFGTHVFTSAGSWDVFLVKLDPAGNIIWAHSEGGPNGDIGYGLAVMPDGWCFVTGWFGESITFHDDTTLTGFGGSDVLIFACEGNGNLIWKRHAGTEGVEYGYKIAVDFNGDCYVTGVAGVGTNFSGTLLQTNGAYVASYSCLGNLRWLNGASGAGVNDIAVDETFFPTQPLGCITGRITGTAVFGEQVLTSIDGSDDAYGAVFNAMTGSWASAQITGGPGSDKGRAAEWKNHPYYTGSFEDTANLFGFNATSAGASDIFVRGDTPSSWGWLLTAGGINNDVPVDVVADGDGNVYICGWYSGTARFGNDILISSGSDSDLDMFVAKINTATANDEQVSAFVSPALRCYPNPFSGSLNITCTAVAPQSKSPSEISIYNLKGEKVRTLSLDRKSSGYLEAVWDGSNDLGRKCPSGVYLLKSSPADGKAVKTLLLN
jgi:hypothetical protein